MRHLTVRNVPPDVAAALAVEQGRLNLSLNQTVIELLRYGLGVQRTRRNGLARLAGRWTAEEQQGFDAATAPFEEIDEELWR